MLFIIIHIALVLLLLALFLLYDCVKVNDQYSQRQNGRFKRNGFVNRSADADLSEHFFDEDA